MTTENRGSHAPSGGTLTPYGEALRLLTLCRAGMQLDGWHTQADDMPARKLCDDVCAFLQSYSPSEMGDINVDKMIVDELSKLLNEPPAHLVSTVAALKRDAEVAGDAAACWYTAAHPYATPMALHEGLKALAAAARDAERLDWMEKLAAKHPELERDGMVPMTRASIDAARGKVS